MVSTLLKVQKCKASKVQNVQNTIIDSSKRPIVGFRYPAAWRHCPPNGRVEGARILGARLLAASLRKLLLKFPLIMWLIPIIVGKRAKCGIAVSDPACPAASSTNIETLSSWTSVMLAMELMGCDMRQRGRVV